MSTSTYRTSAWLLFIASLFPASGCAATTSANTFAALWQPGWTCGQAASVNKAFLRSLTERNALHGYALNGIPVPILLGQNPEQSGAILFVKHEGKWQAYPIADGSVVLAAYSTPAFNRLMLFATGGREGPGNDYLLLYGKNQLSEFGCANAPFPAELSRPDWGNAYPGLHDFNMNTQGVGTLITAANIVEGKTEHKHWYQYTTRDWGRSWGEPLNLQSMPPSKQGIFLPLQEVPASPWLLNSLLNSKP
ncbi:hypothetical protein [Thiothrix lacustris]|jgi:hypothetical protein|uniref:Uncharacterized protein n=1 Tax=Thiothrix lacustris TaxID=525917 RepID=A0ABY9MQS2_9GAMM|nr:hypothetical protein [Thiothrix lacustris]WML90989.1 hypothetical protein RCF98_01235 [Thiothrix lacustris]WMP17110.1 hypothetical protein RCS87_17265 [Thiothrix lacustris]